MGPGKLKISPLNPNTREHSDEAFVEGGLWERHDGRLQTRRFAECFHRCVRIPWPDFSVLDVGCALGDAIGVWHQKYPGAKLYGCDFSETAIGRCRADYGQIAQFFRASIEEISGCWDVIYCSNTLEHFEQHLEIAEALIVQCKVLFVLTPFGELRGESPLAPAPGQYHVATFYRNTFDPLIQREKASRVETAIGGCPGAWGLTRLQRLRWAASSSLRGRYLMQEPLQILYAIHSAGSPEGSYLEEDKL